jgi:cystathionine beta-lyase
VLALTAHIAAYQQGAVAGCPAGLSGRESVVYRSGSKPFPKLNWQPPEATYLAWIDLRPLNIDDRALQKVLIEQQKVAIMPGYTYGKEGNGFVRLNAGCPRSKLEQGVQRLIAGINTLL